MKYISGAALAIVLLAVTSFAQSTFNGYNVVMSVPTNQRASTCAVRYVPPGTVITITDLDSSTPLKITSCDGTSPASFSGNTATFRANPSTFRWCFRGEDKRYKITYSGDAFSGPVTYNWVASDDAKTQGFWNIRDFGAVGDGQTDDTLAFKSAMAVIASNNGGTLTIPDGDYIVTSPVTLPSGIIIQGSNGLQSMASTSNITRPNPTRITLSGTNRALFQIGECVEHVSIRDIELYARSDDGTTGIEAAGAYQSSQGLNLDRISFNHFFRGISATGLPQTSLNWQFDYIKVNACRFIYNRDAGIYTNVRNSDWKIEGTVFTNPARRLGQNANSMHFERVGGVVISDTFSGGFPNALGGTFINILDSGIVTIIGSSSEAMTNSLVYNDVNNPNAGDYSQPITIVNSVFGDPIIFKARRMFVSLGSLYYGSTFQADERVRVYSTGDRFCYDGNILGCQGAAQKNFDRATVVFMTGQPGEGQVQGHPTFFGTDVQFGAGVQMPSFNSTALPTGKPNGSMVYCANCRRQTTPCSSGGSGAPAMMVGGQWSCL